MSVTEDYEELRVKITHPKAVAIIRSIQRSSKKNFLEDAILSLYNDIRIGSKISSSVYPCAIAAVESMYPSVQSNIDSNIIEQLLSSVQINQGVQVQGSFKDTNSKTVIDEVIEEEIDEDEKFDSIKANSDGSYSVSMNFEAVDVGFDF